MPAGEGCGPVDCRKPAFRARGSRAQNQGLGFQRPFGLWRGEVRRGAAPLSAYGVTPSDIASVYSSDRAT
jgi:hypothetical protein